MAVKNLLLVEETRAKNVSISTISVKIPDTISVKYLSSWQNIYMYIIGRLRWNSSGRCYAPCKVKKYVQLRNYGLVI